MAHIVTGWQGDDWRPIADLTVPRMQAYAEKHGHEFDVFEFDDEVARPVSWKKLYAIAQAFETAEQVLWLDADVLVVDDSEDICAAVPCGKRHAMVRHATTEGDVPNAGVWVLDRAMLGPIVACAMDDRFVNHKWWEQAALLSRLGFGITDGQCRHTITTPLYQQTHWLDESWNVWRGSPATVRPRFVHACGVTENRLQHLQGFAT